MHLPSTDNHSHWVECSCANSCEAVPEILLHREAPLTFHPYEADFQLPPSPPRANTFHADGREQAIRLWLISQLQRREFSLPRRMLLLGSALKAMDEALTAHDSARVDRLLKGEEILFMPAMPGRVSTGPGATQKQRTLCGAPASAMDLVTPFISADFDAE